jgi:hypothetical protein
MKTKPPAQPIVVSAPPTADEFTRLIRIMIEAAEAGQPCPIKVERPA